MTTTAIRQRGVSLWLLLWTLLTLAVVILLFMKLFPPYYDNLRVKEGLEVLAQEETLRSMTRDTMIRRLDSILYLDYAHEVVDLKRAFRISKADQSITMSVNYEVVVPLVYNLNALIQFENVVVASR
jgi:hypothetical protein